MKGPKGKPVQLSGGQSPPKPEHKARVCDLWSALVHLEQEAVTLVGWDVGTLIGCARMALEQQWQGTVPPQQPSPSELLH